MLAIDAVVVGTVGLRQQESELGMLGLTAMGTAPWAIETGSLVEGIHPGCMQARIAEAGGKVYSDCYILVSIISDL